MSQCPISNLQWALVVAQPGPDKRGPFDAALLAIEALAVQLDGEAQSFLDRLQSQHVAIAYGDHCAELAADALWRAVMDYLVTAREPWRRLYRT